MVNCITLAQSTLGYLNVLYYILRSININIAGLTEVVVVVVVEGSSGSIVVVVIQDFYGSITTRQKYKETSSMDCGNGDPMHEVCIPHSSSRHKNNSNKVVRNLEERNVGTKGKSPKQDLISAKDITIQLPEGCESPYHRLD